MATFLNDIIKEIAGELEAAAVPLHGDADSWNEQLENDAYNNSSILYDLAQTGTMEITRSKKGYISYNTTLLFMKLPVNAPDSRVVDIEDAVNEMQALAYQFFARLRNVQAWRVHPLNNAESISPSFTEVYDRFDTRLAGVSAQLVIRIDPGFDITKVCDD